MKFALQNIGKIKSADLLLKGITVIAGDNNTGKTTVGRALYSFLNSLYNIDGEVVGQRHAQAFREIRGFFNTYRRPLDWRDRELTSALDNFIEGGDSHRDTLRRYLLSRFMPLVGESEISKCLERLDAVRSLSNKAIRYQIINNYFEAIFRGQCVSLRTGVDQGLINAVVDGHEVSMTLSKTQASYSSDINVQHKAYFVDSPDLLNSWGSYRYFSGGASLSASIRNAITRKMEGAEESPADSAVDDLFFADKYDQFESEVVKITKGKFEFDDNNILRFNEVLEEDGKSVSFDLNNVSEGLKSFGVMELLLRYRILREKDVLILDEPEVHLHPEWQLEYAKLIVTLQKAFNLRVLITTHSSNFLLALRFYAMILGRSDKLTSYRIKHDPENVRYSILRADDPYDWDDVYLSFVQATQKLGKLHAEAFPEKGD